MLKQTPCNLFKGLIVSLGVLTLMTISPWALAQSFLESPTSGSFESGIGLIRGWVCNASAVDVIIDSGTEAEIQLATAYPTRRSDTLGPCGDSDNGFGVTINWNNIGDGVHNLRALADGIEFANVNFVVTTLGDPPFRTDLSGEFSLNDFPFTGTTTLTRWSEAHQNFVIFSDQTIPANPSAPSIPGTHLESPTQGSFESGVALIRGWVCEAEAVEIVIDPGPDEIRRAAAYPTRRADTANVCGDNDNGFGVTINWNNLEHGVHTLSALADGVEFANVNFAVTKLGDGFLTGLSGDYSLTDFPISPQQTTLRWSEPHQNFVISTSTATGDKTALIAAIADQLNPLGVIAADPSNFGSLFGVRTTRSSTGQTTAVQSLDWADLDAGLWARLLLGTNGLPDQYNDSQGIEARFDNYTDNSVEVSFFDSTGALIFGPETVTIDLSRLIPLQDLLGGLSGISTSQAQSFNNPQKSIISLAETATLDKFNVELIWASGIALNEMFCQVDELGFANQIATAGCEAEVVKGFRSLATAPGGAFDPLVQRALQFSRQDLDNVPCNAGESSNTCFQEAVTALREIESEQGGDEGGEPSPEIPDVPANVQASDGLFSDRVVINWDAVTNATSYEIFRDGSQIGQEASASFNDFNATAETVYSYQVAACNDAGCSEPSVSDEGFADKAEPTLYLLTLDTAGPGTGTVRGGGNYAEGTEVALTATPDPGSSFAGWSPAPCAESFAMPADNLTCTATFTVLPPETYTLTLTTAGTGAGTVSGDGEYSEGDTVNLLADPNSTSTFDGWTPSPCAASFTMPAQDLTCAATFTLIDSPPSVPVISLVTKGVSNDYVQIIWEFVASATYYEVYRDGTLISQPNEAHFLDTSMTPGQRYNYTVKACSDIGCSEESSAESGYAVLSPPNKFSASCDYSGPGSNGTPVLSWGSVSGAVDYYNVYEATRIIDLINAPIWGTTPSSVTSINGRAGFWYGVSACNNDTGCSIVGQGISLPSCDG